MYVTPGIDIVNNETCQDNDEFKLNPRTSVVIDCTVIINNINVDT